MWDQREKLVTLFNGHALRLVNGMFMGWGGGCGWGGWDTASEGMCS